MAFKAVIHSRAEEAYLQTVEYLMLISGGNAAKNFIAEFDKQVSLVTDNPEVYGLSRVPKLARAGYRAALVNSYIFLYYVSGSEVHIAFLFHQSQDYARYII